MRPDIRAVMFDMGGTLEEIYYDDAMRLEATRGLQEILKLHGIDPGLSVPDLYAIVKAGMKQYQKWRVESERELPPARVWSEFVFTNRNLAKERFASIGEELAVYYDLHFYKRSLRPETGAALRILRERNFRLGVISNVFSRGAVSANLARYGLTRYFEVVLTSACFGWRKPNARIFLEAARLIKLPPVACAYVGDTVSRDVVGARRAGYGLAIQIKSFLTARSDREIDVEPPDAVIDNLMQVVELVTKHAAEQSDVAN